MAGARQGWTDSATEPGSRWRVFAAAAAVGVLALVVRVAHLGALDVWEDEVYAYTASTDLIRNLLRWDTLQQQGHSPLPFIELKFVRQVLGDSAWALRLPAVLYATATAVLLYVAGRRMFGEGGALVGAILFAINPFCMDWTRMARPYAHWLFWSVVLMALAEAAVRQARSEAPSPLNWRWWTLGLVLMAAHASAVHALATLAAAVAWLGIVAVVEWFDDRSRARVIALGAALAGGVYLCSWALTGLGKLLIYLSTPREGMRGFVPPSLGHTVRRVLSEQAGYVGWVWALGLWLAAMGGLAILFWQGRPRKWRAGLLLALVGLVVWANYPQVAPRTGFNPRYAMVGVLLLSVGVGVLAAALWHACRGRMWWGRVALAGAGVGLAVLWTPSWRMVYGQPVMALRTAVAPILESARPDDALVMVPDWYAAMDVYYHFTPRVRLMRPPREARYITLEADRLTGASIKPFVDDFERYRGGV